MWKLTLMMASAAFAATALSASTLSASAAGPGASGSLASSGPAQCSASAPSLKLKFERAAASRPAYAARRAATNLGKLSAGPKGAGDTYHCCDADGSCSGPVDALTICPVIKVWCRVEKNQCICD